MKKSKSHQQKEKPTQPITDLEKITSLHPWETRPRRKCDICGKKAARYTKTAQAGAVFCQRCCTDAVEKVLDNIKVDQWPKKRVEKALSSRGSIGERLAVLTHIHDIQARMDILDLLIENLGFVSDHPLSHTVRQKAFDACTSVHNPKQLLEKIFKKKTFINWQQRLNITQICYHISPTHPDTIAKFEMTARDPSPSARIYMAKALNEINKVWAKQLWNDLCIDPNPLVRDACVQIAAEKNKIFYPREPLRRLPKIGEFNIDSHTGAPKKRQQSYTRRSTTATTKKRTDPYTPFEQIVKEGINFRRYPHSKINAQYLTALLDFIDPASYGQKKYDSLKKKSKDACIRLIAAALSNKNLFKKLLESLPAQVGILIYLCTWENRHAFSKTELQRLISLKKTGKDQQGKLPELPPAFLPFLKKPFPPKINWDVEVLQNPAFFLFDIRRTWESYDSKAGYKFNLPQAFIPQLKKVLPHPTLYDVVPVPEQSLDPQVYIVHKDEQFFEQLPAILAFISQANLEFTKNGDKIKVNSLKKMATLCGMNEFYEKNQGAVKYLKTSSIANFFISGSEWKAEELKDLPIFMKNRIKSYLEFKGHKTIRCREFLNHVKYQRPEYESDKLEKKIRHSFKTLLTLLPRGEWVSVENVVTALCYRDLPTNPFLNGMENSDIRMILSRENISSFSHRYYYDRYTNVSQTNTILTISLPLIKALLFLFGSLNMVSLAYSEPVNDHYQLRDKPYLSIYDGLAYIRLTDFGLFVLDKKRSFSAPIEKQTAKIIIDETRTLLALSGEDPVKRLALESVGKKITTYSYLVDYQSFLNNCSNRKDVENKINYFRTHISKNPPKIWEAFFQSLLARMEPLEIVKNMYILKVKQDKDLIALLTTDPVLKKHVIKAENYHLIVPRRQYPTVKKRLAQFGFF